MRRSSFSFLVSLHVPGTNDPETGGIYAQRTFGSGSRGNEAAPEALASLAGDAAPWSSPRA